MHTSRSVFSFNNSSLSGSVVNAASTWNKTSRLISKLYHILKARPNPRKSSRAQLNNMEQNNDSQSFKLDHFLVLRVSLPAVTELYNWLNWIAALSPPPFWEKFAKKIPWYTASLEAQLPLFLRFISKVMPKNFRKFQVLQKSSKLAIRVLWEKIATFVWINMGVALEIFNLIIGMLWCYVVSAYRLVIPVPRKKINGEIVLITGICTAG